MENDFFVIGMPVFNNQITIKHAIDCILNQTMKTWELFIYDDCSSDNSFEIAKTYTSNKDNIKVFKNSTNLGQARNFNKCLSLKNFGYKYLSIKGADDHIYPNFYEECIDFLEKNQDYVMCMTEGTNTIGKESICSHDDDDPYNRCEKLLSNFGCGNMNYGVFRCSALDKVSYFEPQQENDRIFHFNLVMMGKVKIIDRVLFNRLQPKRTPEQYRRACCFSSFGQAPSDGVPCLRYLQMFLGHIRLCYTTFTNNLDPDKLCHIVYRFFKTNEYYNTLLNTDFLDLQKWLRKHKSLATYEKENLYLLYKEAVIHMKNLNRIND